MQFNRVMVSVACLLLAVFCSPTTSAADWPQWCGTDGKNMVSTEKNLPESFEPGERRDDEGLRLARPHVVERPDPDDLEAVAEEGLEPEVLRGDLARRVRSHGPQRRVLGDGDAPGDPVDLGRRDDDDTGTGFELARHLEEHERAERVHPEGLRRRLPGTRPGGLQSSRSSG